METVEQTFVAKLDVMPAMVEFVSATAESFGVHPKRIMHLELAVEEATANICSYAYEIPPGEVIVQITREPEMFRIKLIDSGVPFDPMAMETPDIKAELESRQVGGLGVFLIRRMLDDVHYSRSGAQNILSLAVRYGEK